MKRLATQELENKNPFPEIFIGHVDTGFRLLQRFLRNYLLDANDVAFIYHRMSQDGFLHCVPHLTFISWLNSQKIIDSKIFETLIERGSLSTKAQSSQRLNAYLLTKEALLPPISEKSEKTT